MKPTEVHLPERRTELLGRTDTVQQLVEAVSAKPLVTVVGAAGCGKTRLSIEVARSAAQAFADGVWFIDLTAADDASQLLDVITTGLGMTAPAVGTVVEALRAFTNNRQMLIVLDNCEHLLDEVSTLADALLGNNSELTLLATSREPLDLDGEYIWTLQPLASRTAGFPLTEAPAVQLFLQRLAAAAPTLHPGDREAELVVEICEGVDGLPLAIELAASLARSFTLDEIATRVRSDLVSLSRIGRGGSSHHATLRGAIELSTASLDPVELAVHRAVAVVPGPFTPALAAHLVDTAPGQASNALAGLVHRSLLTPRGAAHSQGPSRFDQLATVRAHGLSAATDQPARAARRRDEWVAGLVADMPPLGDAEEIAWHARLDDDYAAVRATLQHCLVEEPDPIGPSTAARLGMYWFYRGMAVEWRHWTALARQSDVADPYDKLLVGSSYAGVAGLVEGGNLYRAWLDDLDQPTISMSYEQTVGLAQYLPAVCLTAWLTGAVDVCQRATDKLRDFAHETGHPRLELFAAVTDVLTRSQGGDPSVLRDIEQCYQQAQIMDNFYARWITSVAGVVAGLTTQRPEHGMRWSNLQMHEFTTLGFEVNVPGLELRGALLTMTGQPYEAIRALAQSRGLARRIGLRWPSLPSTPDTLAAAQDQLTAADSDRAYREGTLGNPAAPTP